MVVKLLETWHRIEFIWRALVKRKHIRSGELRLMVASDKNTLLHFEDLSLPSSSLQLCNLNFKWCQMKTRRNLNKIKLQHTRQHDSSNPQLYYNNVIVMTANMGCAQCRKKVSQVISKMTGLREYTVDVSNKQVTVKADFGFRWNVKDDLSKNEKRKDWHPLQAFKCSSLNCFGKQMVAD